MSLHDNIKNFTGDVYNPFYNLSLQMGRHLRIRFRNLQRCLLRSSDRHELIAAMFPVYLKHQFDFVGGKARGIVDRPRRAQNRPALTVSRPQLFRDMRSEGREELEKGERGV